MYGIDISSAVPAGSGHLKNAGFYTIPLNPQILLDDSEKFAIIVKITTPKAGHPVAVEYNREDGLSRADLSDGEGYLSRDGRRWESAEDVQHCNICLKGYMR